MSSRRRRAGRRCPARAAASRSAGCPSPEEDLRFDQRRRGGPRALVAGPRRGRPRRRGRRLDPYHPDGLDAGADDAALTSLATHGTWPGSDRGQAAHRCVMHLARRWQGARLARTPAAFGHSRDATGVPRCRRCHAHRRSSAIYPNAPRSGAREAGGGFATPPAARPGRTGGADAVGARLRRVRTGGSCSVAEDVACFGERRL